MLRLVVLIFQILVLLFRLSHLRILIAIFIEREELLVLAKLEPASHSTILTTTTNSTRSDRLPMSTCKSQLFLSIQPTQTTPWNLPLCPNPNNNSHTVSCTTINTGTTTTSTSRTTTISNNGSNPSTICNSNSNSINSHSISNNSNINNDIENFCSNEKPLIKEQLLICHDDMAYNTFIKMITTIR